MLLTVKHHLWAQGETYECARQSSELILNQSEMHAKIFQSRSENQNRNRHRNIDANQTMRKMRGKIYSVREIKKEIMKWQR